MSSMEELQELQAARVSLQLDIEISYFVIKFSFLIRSSMTLNCFEDDFKLRFDLLSNFYLIIIVGTNNVSTFRENLLQAIR